MRDSISEQRALLLHPALREEAILAIEDAESNFPANIRVRIVQGLRTKDEQIALYAQGRTKSGKIVTKAQWFQTFHFYGLAVDFGLLYDKDNNGSFEELSWDTAKDLDKDGIADWNEVVKAFEKHGWEWGGVWRTFKDLPHVQKTFGYKWQTLLAKYNSGDLIPGTIYVKL